MSLSSYPKAYSISSAAAAAATSVATSVQPEKYVTVDGNTAASNVAYQARMYHVNRRRNWLGVNNGDLRDHAIYCSCCPGLVHSFGNTCNPGSYCYRHFQSDQSRRARGLPVLSRPIPKSRGQKPITSGTEDLHPPTAKRSALEGHSRTISKMTVEVSLEQDASQTQYINVRLPVHQILGFLSAQTSAPPPTTVNEGQPLSHAQFVALGQGIAATVGGALSSPVSLPSTSIAGESGTCRETSHSCTSPAHCSHPPPIRVSESLSSPTTISSSKGAGERGSGMGQATHEAHTHEAPTSDEERESVLEGLGMPRPESAGGEGSARQRQRERDMHLEQRVGMALPSHSVPMNRDLSPARRFTEEGFRIMTEHELGINNANAGMTDDCPFDCQCCF
ncbi:protein of unknown function DUF1764, eukaryotic [Kipferlia bialata]|uniref:Uncharacterized protein n=1 Tax=Kipferlia bialata TaxID=797122 RepID=A0A9K3CR17_9EUKA|nr:protein of unknown function DUF1764, eukaryotic [Kipferlia bialata]|eukprot:g2585.t1